MGEGQGLVEVQVVKVVPAGLVLGVVLADLRVLVRRGMVKVKVRDPARDQCSAGRRFLARVKARGRGPEVVVRRGSGRRVLVPTKVY